VQVDPNDGTLYYLERARDGSLFQVYYDGTAPGAPGRSGGPRLDATLGQPVQILIGQEGPAVAAPVALAVIATTSQDPALWNLGTVDQAFLETSDHHASEASFVQPGVTDNLEDIFQEARLA
jgi:hypothetical protein